MAVKAEAGGKAGWGRQMNEFEVVTMIGRPVEEVFAVVQDVTRTPLWNPGLLEVRRTSDGPLGVGATMIYMGTFLGRRYESPVACTGFAENKQLATATTGGRSISRSTRRWSQPAPAPS
jgi:hypothetical protein